MPLNVAKFIKRFINVRPAASNSEFFPWELQFFSDANKQHSDESTIQVPREGGLVHFFKTEADPLEDLSWKFHDLTIHPLVSETGEVDLRWFVSHDEVRLYDPGSGTRRKFSYSLSLLIEKNGKTYKAYFDPQLINTGGGAL